MRAHDQSWSMLENPSDTGRENRRMTTSAVSAWVLSQQEKPTLTPRSVITDLSQSRYMFSAASKP